MGIFKLFCPHVDAAKFCVKRQKFKIEKVLFV